MNCKQSHFKKNRCLVFLFLIIAFVFVKIPFSSVATNGNTIYNCMTADYWNFAKDIVTFGQEVLGSRKAPFTITVSEVTGINSVTDSSRKMKVYSIEGVLINSEATAETLKKLSRGIYVIDGQKFMVK